MRRRNYNVFNFEKYKTGKKRCSVTLVLLFFLLPHFIQAQQDPPPVADTLVEYTDTAIVAPPPVTGDEGDSDDMDITDSIAMSINAVTEQEVNFVPLSSPGAALDSVHLRAISDSSKAAMAKDNDFWYANAVFKKKQEAQTGNDSTPLIFTDGFEIFLWLLVIVGFITFLAIYLTNSNVSLFRKTSTIISAETDVETSDIFSINYQREIDKATAAGNYRLAVRLMFLRLLRNLSDKQVISYAHDKTNFDYLMQVSQTRFYKPFFRITRDYEYVWYGLFNIDNERFDVIKNDFLELEKQL